MRASRSIPLIALLVSFFVLVPSVASADSEYVRDELRDVVRTFWVKCEDPDDPCIEKHETDPSQRYADIVWSRHTYVERRLVLRMKLRDVVVQRRVGTYVSWEVRGPHGSGLRADVLFGEAPLSLDLTNKRGDVECEGARATVRRRTATFVLVVPKRCLARMPWVRVSAGVLVQDFRTSRIWHDDPRTGDDLQVEHGVAAHLEGRRLYLG